MKTLVQPAVITPGLIVLALLTAVVVFIGVRDLKVPLLSNLRVDIILLLILVMAMCTWGIGRVAATGQWTHPLAILGYILGALIFLVDLSGFFGWKLFLIQTGQQALLAMAILMAAKVVGTVIHYLLNRSSGV